MNKTVFELIRKWAEKRTKEEHFKKYPAHLNIKSGWDEIRWCIALDDAADLDKYDIACQLFEPAFGKPLSEMSNEETVDRLLVMHGYDDPQAFEDDGGADGATDELIIFLMASVR